MTTSHWLSLLLLVWRTAALPGDISDECGEWQPYWSRPPWVVEINNKNSSGMYPRTCQGTLIAPNAVITGARCLAGLPSPRSAESYLVATGVGVFLSGDLMNNLDQSSKVTSVETHPLYNVTGHEEYNLALLKLESPIQLTRRAALLCLNLHDEHFNRDLLKHGNKAMAYDMKGHYLGVLLEEDKCRERLELKDEHVRLSNQAICFSHDVESCSNAGVALEMSSGAGAERWYFGGAGDWCFPTSKVISYTTPYKAWDWIKTCLAPAPTPTEQDAVSGCPLPVPPPKGSYIVRNHSKLLVPGELVPPFALLSYSCEGGYTLQSDELVYCQEDLTWSTAPTCVQPPAFVASSLKRGCSLPESLTVDFSCKSSEGVSIACGRSVPSGTTVSYRCKAYHVDVNEYNYQLVCEDGYFDNYVFPKCVPECGAIPSEAATLVIHGQTARRSAFPWHVAVYQERNEDYLQVCGGSVLRRHVIISAAHCFYQSSRVLPAETFAVAVGKLYRDWSHPEELSNGYIQKSKVKSIFVPALYSGIRQNYQNDLAILELRTPLHFSELVHPVCLEIKDQLFNKVQLNPGNMGRVTGWGLTAEGTSSDLLQYLNIPIIGYPTCVQEMLKYNFVKYITQDKICAGYTNGSAVCKGDSGGGLVLPLREFGTREKWFLRGIVSVSPLGQDGTCRRETYSAYTSPFELREWINDVFRQLNA